MLSYHTGSGGTVRLAKVIGQGGEGTTYVATDPTVAAKIYFVGKSEERQNKVATIVASRLHERTRFVAFPIDTLVDDTGRFVGFTMNHIAESKPVHQLYAPGSRKLEFGRADFRFLIRSAANIARAVASVHQIGCVIGDINHSGILISHNAKAALIDADSFQIRSGTVVYRCLVGVGEFTPPELQGRAFGAVDREPDHDAFGLAVLIFQLVFMGRHPFAGRYGGAGDMPIEKAIREGRFAYSLHRKHETRMDPPPFVPTLTDVGPDMTTAFERAFAMRGNGSSPRPSAAQWVQLLERFESDLTVCTVNATHQVSKHAAACPWCRLESGMGVVLFPAIADLGTFTTRPPFDLIAAISAIDRVPGPGSLADPVSLMPPVVGLAKSTTATKAAQKHRTRRAIGVLLVLACIGLIAAGFNIGYLGFLLAAYLLFGQVSPDQGLLSANAQAELEWTAAVREWGSETSPVRFDQKKAQLMGLVSEYRNLPSKERANLEALDKRRRELQLQSFLESHLLTRAKISGIGDSRRATLASYGIENAFDVTDQRVRRVPGFGDAMTARLLGWRASVEAKFTFNTRLGTDPSAIQRVKRDIDRRRGEIELALARGPIELEQLKVHILAARARPTQRLLQAHRTLQQARFDLT